MPLYEIDRDGELTPFRRVKGGPELYEKEIEDLFWANPDEFIGESLFVIGKQVPLPTGGRADIVALDKDARVVVVEAKREVDRSQLAQCLEYAGWARTTNLDELSSMYHRGSGFFSDWQEFTDSVTPMVINRAPRLILVAHSMHGRTSSALDFLLENGVPINIVEVSIYEDSQKRRFLDIEGEHEPELPSGVREDEVDHTKIKGRRVRVADLIDAGLLRAGDSLTWTRPRRGESYRATVTENGAIQLPDGRAFPSPSRAAMEAANVPAYDGWYAWRVTRFDGLYLNDLRLQLAGREIGGDERIEETPSSAGSIEEVQQADLPTL